MKKSKSDGTWIFCLAFGASVGGTCFGPIGFVVCALLGIAVGQIIEEHYR